MFIRKNNTGAEQLLQTVVLASLRDCGEVESAVGGKQRHEHSPPQEA